MYPWILGFLFEKFLKIILRSDVNVGLITNKNWSLFFAKKSSYLFFMSISSCIANYGSPFLMKIYFFINDYFLLHFEKKNIYFKLFLISFLFKYAV